LTSQLASIKKILVGVLGPLSTGGGRAMLNGVLLAVEDLNKTGGILGRELDVVVYDDSEAGVSIPSKSALGYAKLADESKVSLVVGPYSSHCALEILNLLRKHRVMVVTSGSVADAIDYQIAADPERFKYFFRTLMNASSQAKDFWLFFRERIIKNFQIKRVAIFYENLLWTDAHLAVYKRAAEQDGVDIVYLAAIDPVRPVFARRLKEARKGGGGGWGK